MTNNNKVLSLTTIAAISAILLVSVPGTAFGSGPPMLILNPDSFTGDAVQGQVINTPVDLEFEFEAGDEISGFTVTGECDDDISHIFNVDDPTSSVNVITADLEITIASGAVIGDVLHCKTSLQVNNSAGDLLSVAEFNILVTVIRDTLDIAPDNITLDAFPGQVLNVDVDFEFPFEAADDIIGDVSFAECDEEFGPISGDSPDIIGGETVITSEFEIPIEEDAAIGSSFHCVIRSHIVDDEGNRVSPIVPFEIWVNITPESVIDDLVEDVDDLGLNNGNTKSLTKKLEQAIKNITNEDPTDDAEACEKLQSFIDQLNAFVNAGKISPEQADPLIDVAESLIDSLCQD